MYDIMYYYEASTVGEAIAFLKKNPKARIVSRESDVFIKTQWRDNRTCSAQYRQDTRTSKNICEGKWGSGDWNSHYLKFLTKRNIDL